jgi:hypothetical protein
MGRPYSMPQTHPNYSRLNPARPVVAMSTALNSTPSHGITGNDRCAYPRPVVLRSGQGREIPPGRRSRRRYRETAGGEGGQTR